MEGHAVFDSDNGVPRKAGRSVVVLGRDDFILVQMMGSAEQFFHEPCK